MNRKVWTRGILSTIGILIICIIIAVHFFNTRITKEVNVAKNFISLLAEKKMINPNINMDKTKFDVLKQRDGDKKYYTVTSKNYGIDLDSKLNVIGFNYILKSTDKVAVSEDNARGIAESYIRNLAKEEYKFKNKIEQSNGELSYFGYIFTRYKNDYPFYSDQIMIQVDKNSGYLAAYSNTKSQGDPKTATISIKSNQAEEITLQNFNKTNTNGKIIHDETYIAYCDNKKKTDTELCYVVTVSGNDIDNIKIRWKYFITTDTGNILDSVKDTVSKTSVK